MVAQLRRSDVETRTFTAGNIGRHPFWVNRYGESRLPVADKLYDCGLFLPNHPGLKVAQIDDICQILIDLDDGFHNLKLVKHHET